MEKYECGFCILTDLVILVIVASLVNLVILVKLVILVNLVIYTHMYDYCDINTLNRMGEMLRISKGVFVLISSVLILYEYLC